jgi:hypothetical protein
MIRLDTKSCVISGKFTPEEAALVRARVAEAGGDLSSATRELWLRELGLNQLSSGCESCEKMLRLFKATMEMSLELGENFTAEKFRSLCQ